MEFLKTVDKEVLTKSDVEKLIGLRPFEEEIFNYPEDEKEDFKIKSEPKVTKDDSKKE